MSDPTRDQGGIMRKIIFMAMIIMMLSACSGLKEGEVFDKEYHPAHTRVVLMPLVISNGKTTMTSLVPVTFFYPDAWSIDIKAFSEKKNKWQKARLWVSHDVYNIVEIGAWYKRTDEDMDEQPRIRKSE